MDLGPLAIVAGAYFLAAFVKGTTGLGFSTTALPFLVLAFGLEATLPLLIIPSVTSNVLVMRSAGHFRESLVGYWPLHVSALPGLAIGLTLLTVLDPALSTAVLGGVLSLYCLTALARPDLRVPAPWVRPLLVPVGLANGVLNGLTGSQVMPALPFLLSLHLPPDRLVQTANIFFTLSSVFMAIGLSTLGIMTPSTVAVSLAGLVCVFLGVRAGTAIRRVLSPEAFRTSVLVVLLVLALTLVGRGAGWWAAVG